MQQLEMTIEGVECRISMGAGYFRQGPAHHYYRAPRWTGLDRNPGGQGASVTMQCRIHFEFTLNNIDYQTNATVTVDNENTGFHPSVNTTRKDSTADPTDSGRARALQIARAVSAKIKGDESLMQRLKDETLKDCIEQCQRMQERLQEEMQVWKNLEAQIKKEGLKCR